MQNKLRKGEIQITEEEIIKCIIGGNMCGIYGSLRK